MLRFVVKAVTDDEFRIVDEESKVDLWSVVFRSEADAVMFCDLLNGQEDKIVGLCDEVRLLRSVNSRLVGELEVYGNRIEKTYLDKIGGRRL